MLILGHAHAEEITAPYSKDDGRTALHIAAALGNVVFVQLLLWVGTVSLYSFSFTEKLVEWGKGVYLASSGRPTDIGLLLGKACCLCSRWGLRGGVFISSVSSLSFIFLFLPCPSLLSPLLPLLSLFSLSLGADTKWPVVKPQHNQSIFFYWVTAHR